MRAVIYARYSSDQQRTTSIDDQIRLCKEKNRARGLEARPGLPGLGDERRDGAQARISGDARGRPRGGIRCRGRRGARSPLPRSGGYRRPVQAPAIRRDRLVTLGEGEIGSCISGSRAR